EATALAHPGPGRLDPAGHGGGREPHLVAGARRRPAGGARRARARPRPGAPPVAGRRPGRARAGRRRRPDDLDRPHVRGRTGRRPRAESRLDRRGRRRRSRHRVRAAPAPPAPGTGRGGRPADRQPDRAGRDRVPPPRRAGHQPHGHRNPPHHHRL
ncbi:MAG: hypothetical protein AVDCRST_MAG41-3506, partial [uncultured Corynebacteriales bacterium]